MFKSRFILSSLSSSPLVKCFFEESTFTAQYVVSCPFTKHCVIIDPVLDFNIYSGKVLSNSADKIINYIQENELIVKNILETHVHADHITSSYYLKKELLKLQNIKVKTCISDKVIDVQRIFSKKYELDIPCNGSEFDLLLKDNDIIPLGDFNIKVLQTPGHTPACLSYLIENNCVFVGDTFFMPDSGTARCDFPGGDAKQLWNSLQRLLSLPDNTNVYICHDYKAGGNRDKFLYKTTIKEEKQNIQLIDKNEEKYIEFRKQRDSKLNAPRLIHPSLQFNLTGGLPKHNFLKIPLSLSILNKE